METKLIAEFCQNHNGKMAILERMIGEAANGGATHGKIQHIFARNVSFRPQFETGLDIDGQTVCIKRPYSNEYSRLKGLEISLENMARFISVCHREGLIPMTTCFDRGSVKAIAELGFKHVKVASYDCGSFQMLRELADHFDELVISTGGTFDEEIEFAASILDGSKFAFLHCVSVYPTPLDRLCLARIEFLRQFTTEVGFSDHTNASEHGVLASKAALALGAQIIERHFTVLNSDETKDGPVSINRAQLAELAAFVGLPIAERIEAVQELWPDWSSAMGTPRRPLSNEEKLNRAYYRGRFATPRPDSVNGRDMIFNWEETPLT